MDDSEVDLQELYEKITAQFERYKEELNCREHQNINSLLYNFNVKSDTLLYKVKYETDKYIRDHLKGRENLMQSDDLSALNIKKSQYLIKLQTLASMLTCHVINDYKKKIEEKERHSSQ